MRRTRTINHRIVGDSLNKTLTNDNELRRLLVGRAEGLHGARVIARHIPSGIRYGHGTVHFLGVLVHRVRRVHVRLEPQQADRVRSGNPLVDGEVVEQPLDNDSRVQGIRLKVAVQDERRWRHHLIPVQHICLWNTNVDYFHARAY